MPTCKDCGQTFEREFRRGPLAQRCPSCAAAERLKNARQRTARYRGRYPDRIAAYKARPETRAREAAWMAARRAADPERDRAMRHAQYRRDPMASTKSRARARGISVDDYIDMFEGQGGVCAICRGPETLRAANGRPRRLAIDHDHKTGEVRGLLCHNCNVAIGHLNDDPELLEAAAGYLRAASRRRLRLVSDKER